MSVSNINSYYFERMNTRRNVGQRRRGVAARNNQVQPQALAEGVALQVNPDELNNEDVRASMAYIEKAITIHAQGITAQVNR